VKVCGRGPLRTADQAQHRGRIAVTAALILGLIFLAGQGLAVLYTSHLWFVELGYAKVFWTRNLTAIVVRSIAAAIAGAFIYLNLSLLHRHLGPVRLRRRYGNLEIAEQVPRHFVTLVGVAIAIVGGWWLASLHFSGNVPLAMWAWLHHASWGVTDPLFHRDLSFYVFTLPVLMTVIDHLLLTAFWCMALVVFGYSVVGGLKVVQNRVDIDPYARNHVAMLLAAFMCILAFRFVAGRYALAVNGTGVHGGVGYTDVHARIAGQWIMAWLAVIAAALIVYGARRALPTPPVAGIAAFIVGALLFGVAYPSLMQKFRVQPNELAREQPYLEWNLAFTRMAFGVDRVDRRHMAYRTATPATWSAAAPTLERLPLWDVDQLLDAFGQVQTFKGYYQFTDVDFDRYPVDGRIQQVGVGVREFKPQGLPASSRSWFALHLSPEFTRGIGAAAALTSTAVQGAPDYLVGELAPIRVAPEATSMLLANPTIYFGELSNDYVIVGSDSVGHAPTGGISIGSFLRKLVFAWRFSDHNLLFATDLNKSSRLLFHRLARERVEEIAPFLTWDRDALPVIADGRIQWVLDGYTTSSSFPLSSRQASTGNSVNYMRGSAKATVDAVTGAVVVYATDAGDPILRSYAAMFPGLVHKSTEMPAWMRAHLRYPAALLSVQAEILRQYHVLKTDAFYRGQDAWDVPAQGAMLGTPRPDEPMDLMLAMPGAGTAPEFVAVLPFTARERQNLTAVLIAQNDDATYGKLTLIDVTADEQVKGPAQIQSLIEQDPEISQQLSLWRQLGTAVELGQLRVLPVEESVLYVEPLFLAAEDKAIPQLHRVLVSDGSNVAMAETLELAISALYAKTGATAVTTAPAAKPGSDAGASGAANNVAGSTQRPVGSGAWPAEALRLYDQAERQLRAGDFAAFGASWKQLHDVLQKAQIEQRKP
jgi:uncharacterized membrane protein (UPF0182 family)